MKINKGVRFREDLPGFLIYLDQRIFILNNIGKQILLLCKEGRKQKEIEELINKNYRLKTSYIKNFIKNLLDMKIIEREVNE